MYRRRFIVGGIVVGSGFAVAGCSGGGNGEDTNDGDDETPTEGDDGTTADGNNSNDDETTTEGGDETATDENGDGEDTYYGQLYTFTDNYAVDIVSYEQDVSGEARYDGDDHYGRWETDEGVYETYHVDGDDYVVFNDQCYVNPGEEVKPETGVESDAEGYGGMPDADVKPKGVEEIDGVQCYKFEVSGEDVQGILTLYLSESTGYLRRVEADWGRLDFHSWGDVDPIEPPDMDCQEMPG